MPLPPKAELQWWYQFYSATERGRDGYDKYRRDFSKLIWQLASPTITLEGDANGAPNPEPSSYAQKFSGKYEHRTIMGGIGHNLPQEAPQAFAQAIVDVGAG